MYSAEKGAVGGDGDLTAVLKKHGDIVDHEAKGEPV